MYNFCLRAHSAIACQNKTVSVHPMNDQPKDIRASYTVLDAGKFLDPEVTASGAARAEVPLVELSTLWINTGTLCNITCQNCYIESSPKNDRLAYFTVAELKIFLDEIKTLGLATKEIGFTGGEPFMNRQTPAMIELALERGFNVLVLTNAMQPMMRKPVRAALLDLNARFGARLSLRVSIDHYTRQLHEAERGPGAFAKTISGLNWLAQNGFAVSIAGRTCWGEDEAGERAGYEQLVRKHGWPVDVNDRSQLVLFPEMREQADIPEITTACWGILNKAPADVMCATSRMVVRRKGAARPVVLPCTLLAYDPGFEMGETLEKASAKHGGNFNKGAVRLNHPHCSQFCVLGGGSCTS